MNMSSNLAEYRASPAERQRVADLFKLLPASGAHALDIGARDCYLSKKLAEFASYNDNLEEVFENREQIEISRYYEKLPKPTLIATQEYLEGKVYYRNPSKEKEKLQ
jgi:hypothetical protein